MKSFNKKNYSKQINSNKHNCNKKLSEVIINNNFMIKYLKMNNINKIIIMQMSNNLINNSYLIEINKKNNYIYLKLCNQMLKNYNYKVNLFLYKILIMLMKHKISICLNRIKNKKIPKVIPYFYKTI